MFPNIRLNRLFMSLILCNALISGETPEPPYGKPQPLKVATAPAVLATTDAEQSTTPPTTPTAKEPTTGSTSKSKSTMQTNSHSENAKREKNKKHLKLSKEIVDNLISRGNKETVLCSLNDLVIVSAIKEHFSKEQVINNNKMCERNFVVAYSPFPPFVYKENNTVTGMLPSKLLY